MGGLVFAARLTRHRVASRLDTKHSILAHRVVQHTHRTLEAQKARARHVSCNLIDTSSKYLFGELCVQLIAAVPGRSGDLPRPLTLCDAIVAPASPHGPHRSLPPRRTARQIIARVTSAGPTTWTRTFSANAMRREPTREPTIKPTVAAYLPTYRPTPAEACANGVQDGEESDVDCGGPPPCLRCEMRKKCRVDQVTSRVL